MANYDMTRRGVVTVTSSDTSPLDVALPSAVKLAQSWRIISIRDTRRNMSTQRGSIALTSSDVSPKDITIASVDLTAAKESISFHQKRTNDYSGVSAILTSETNLQLKFGTIASGDTIDVDWLVVESKPSRGATARLIDSETLRVEWDGTLVAGETIVIAYEAVDVEDLRIDMKNVLFKIARVLGFQGENSIQDLCTYDQAGNPVTFRIRTFDTAENKADATKDLPADDPLETGELSRVNVELTWVKDKNRPKWIVSSLEDVASPVPGV